MRMQLFLCLFRIKLLCSWLYSLCEWYSTNFHKRHRGIETHWLGSVQSWADVYVSATNPCIYPSSRSRDGSREWGMDVWPWPWPKMDTIISLPKRKKVNKCHWWVDGCCKVWRRPSLMQNIQIRLHIIQFKAQASQTFIAQVGLAPVVLLFYQGTAHWAQHSEHSTVSA